MYTYHFKVCNLYGHYLFVLLRFMIFPTQIALFTGLLFASIAVIPKIDVGLDQELALPKVSEIKKNLSHTCTSKCNNIKLLNPIIFFLYTYMYSISHLGCQYGFNSTGTNSTLQATVILLAMASGKIFGD